MNYDLIIIGAGSTGSCIAYEAVKRDLKVALIDSGDIGGGTSCRSTKLLHGGVRYLELAFKSLDISQLRLVKEALAEREYWLRAAPFLSRRIELGLPTQNTLQQGYYRLGLCLYDILAGEQNTCKSKKISKTEIEKALPLIKDNLNGGIVYSDGQFNDSRLNLALALTAEKEGASLRTYCKIIKLNHGSNKKLCGITIENKYGIQEELNGSAIINAAGLGVDKIREMADPGIEPKTIISRGIHLVLKEELCPEGMGLLIPSTKDGRVLFVLPFFGKTQIGTTDTRCTNENAQKPSNEEKQYLIDYVKKWFPTIGEPTVKSTWAGGRALLKPNKEKNKSSQVVREHEVEVMASGLISAIGGKWTTCRPLALDTLKAAANVLNKKLQAPRQIPLIGTNKNYSQTKNGLKEGKQQIKDLLPDSKCRSRQIAHLQSQYGLNALSVVSKAEKATLQPLSNIIPICKAEIDHAIQYEYARTPNDVLIRRSRLAMVDTDEAKRLLPTVNKCLERHGLKPGELNLEQ